MGSHFDSIMRRALALIMGLLLAVILFGGCHDPATSNFEAEHRRLSSIAKQDLRQSVPSGTIDY
ncbi:MAG: hypothetical protein ACYS19_16155 [Planctomycetota bacterium]